METWILSALLGIGLAAATGFRTFLPLLMLGLAAKFQLFGIHLADAMSWLDSPASLAALGIATVVELAADKVPAVDHALSLVGTVIRPIAGAVAAGAAFASFDPMIAAIAGLIIGAPTALAFHAAQASTRVVSTTTTAGLGNPLVSVAEDLTATFMAALAMIAPILIPVLLVLILYGVWRLVSVARAGRKRSAA